VDEPLERSVSQAARLPRPPSSERDERQQQAETERDAGRSATGRRPGEPIGPAAQ